MTTRCRSLSTRLAGVSGPATGSSFVAAIVGAMVLAHQPIPRPGAAAEDVRTYYRDSATAARFSVAGQAVSILAQAVFTGCVTHLAVRATPGARLLPAAVVVSGAGSVAALATSAATHASLTGASPRDDTTLTRRARLVFVAGGPLHGVAYGVFIAALTLAARRTGLFGRAATITGVVSALAGLASPLYFRWETAGWLIPIGRFSGYLLAGLAGTRLASTAATPQRQDDR